MKPKHRLFFSVLVSQEGPLSHLQCEFCSSCGWKHFEKSISYVRLTITYLRKVDRVLYDNLIHLRTDVSEVSYISFVLILVQPAIFFRKFLYLLKIIAYCYRRNYVIVLRTEKSTKRFVNMIYGPDPRIYFYAPVQFTFHTKTRNSELIHVSTLNKRRKLNQKAGGNSCSFS